MFLQFVEFEFDVTVAAPEMLSKTFGHFLHLQIPNFGDTLRDSHSAYGAVLNPGHTFEALVTHKVSIAALSDRWCDVVEADRALEEFDQRSQSGGFT